MTGITEGKDTAEKKRLQEAAAYNAGGHAEDFLTVSIDNQLFGIPVLQVQDVLGNQMIAKIPLAPAEVAGSLNLRGRIVTAIDVRRRLGLPPADGNISPTGVVVDYKNELYSLIIDKVGDVLSLPDDLFETTPATLDEKWQDVSKGIYQLEDRLLIILDVPILLDSVYIHKEEVNLSV